MYSIKVDKAFLTSKVARRIFILFILCALVPLSTISLITFELVSRELNNQAINRIRQTCKAKGFEIYEHLLFLETELEMIETSRREGWEGVLPRKTYAADKEADKRFKSVVVMEGTAKKAAPLNDMDDPPQPDPSELGHLGLGRSLLITREGAEGAARIFMLRLLEGGASRPRLLTAEINPQYLWGIGGEGLAPSGVDMVIIDPERRILFSSTPRFEFNVNYLEALRNSPASGSFEHTHSGETHIAGYWSLFLKHRFFIPNWTIVFNQAGAVILEPVATFKQIYLLLIVLTFLIVSLLSVVQIRKRLVPVEKLKKGAERIARGEFGGVVDIKSGDEFEGLGNSFNEMSKKLKMNQALLVQTAKMSAFGQMAAGVVHEIGQPLTSISGFTDLLLDGKTTKKQKRRLEIIQRELGRLHDIVSKFKSFSRVSDETMTPLSINRVLRGTYTLLEHQIQIKGIQYVEDAAEDLPLIMGDENSLRQVFVNLSINAFDALGENRDGERMMHIKTYARNGEVHVDFKDNGPGIPEEVRRRIFDPFFTTKPEDVGSGLGLAIIDSILHKHSARIQCDSEEGRGARFVLSFPAKKK